MKRQNEDFKKQLDKLQEERTQEIETWEQKKVDLEQTVAKFKKIANFNLTNHKDATDRLRTQIHELNGISNEKDTDNKSLKDKLTLLKISLGKLEQIQMTELSRGDRSLSNRRSLRGKKLGGDTNRYISKNSAEINTGSVSSRRQQAKLNLYSMDGFHTQGSKIHSPMAPLTSRTKTKLLNINRSPN